MVPDEDSDEALKDTRGELPQEGRAALAAIPLVRDDGVRANDRNVVDTDHNVSDDGPRYVHDFEDGRDTVSGNAESEVFVDLWVAAMSDHGDGGDLA